MNGSVRSVAVAGMAALAWTAGCGVTSDERHGAGSYTTEPGFARPGADYEVLELTHFPRDHANCKAACESRPKCKSYTYVKPRAEGASAGCLLNNDTPPPVQDACCISGVKDGQARQPAIPAPRLIGLWQMHCPSSAPDAFEPMTISGRIQLVLEPDGNVTGTFGEMPLTGKQSAWGKVEGSAEDSGSRVVWQGQLEMSPHYELLSGSDGFLLGSGGFRFEREQGGCKGKGQWSSKR